MGELNFVQRIKEAISIIGWRMFLFGKGWTEKEYLDHIIKEIRLNERPAD